jgi:hypothetical protein
MLRSQYARTGPRSSWATRNTIRARHIRLFVLPSVAGTVAIAGACEHQHEVTETMRLPAIFAGR